MVEAPGVGVLPRAILSAMMRANRDTVGRFRQHTKILGELFITLSHVDFGLCLVTLCKEKKTAGLKPNKI